MSQKETEADSQASGAGVRPQRCTLRMEGSGIMVAFLASAIVAYVSVTEAVGL